MPGDKKKMARHAMKGNQDRDRLKEKSVFYSNGKEAKRKKRTKGGGAITDYKGPENISL